MRSPSALGQPLAADIVGDVLAPCLEGRLALGAHLDMVDEARTAVTDGGAAPRAMFGVLPVDVRRNGIRHV